MYPARMRRKTKAPRNCGVYILASGEVDRAIEIRLRTRERISDPHGGFNSQESNDIVPNVNNEFELFWWYPWSSCWKASSGGWEKQCAERGSIGPSCCLVRHMWRDNGDGKMRWSEYVAGKQSKHNESIIQAAKRKRKVKEENWGRSELSDRGEVERSECRLAISIKRPKQIVPICRDFPPSRLP